MTIQNWLIAALMCIVTLAFTFAACMSLVLQYPHATGYFAGYGLIAVGCGILLFLFLQEIGIID